MIRRFNLMLMVLLTALLFNSSSAWSEGTEWRFVDLNDGTVFDMNSNLRWLKNANCFGKLNRVNLETPSNALASTSCGLNDGSVAGDWHLSYFNELNVFRGYTAANLNTYGFTNVQDYRYWSDTRETDNGYFWYVDLSTHSYGTEFQNYLYYGWPVRGGQFWTSNNFIMVGTAVFGVKVVGKVYSGQIFTLKNRGAVPLSLSGIALGGTNAGEFVLATGGGRPCASLTPTLAAGTVCTVTVTAKPTSAGSKSATLSITEAGWSYPSINAPLSAVAVMSVTYNGNGNSAGNVPSDSTAYANGATVNALDNSGALTKNGYVFNGWNTAADGSGINYEAGATFGYAGITTLYARWATVIAPPSGLINWWRGESNGIDTAGGLTGTPYNIFYTGVNAGKVGQAFSLNGSTASMTVPDNPKLSFGTNEFSIAAWIKTTDTRDWQRIVTKRASSGSANWYSLVLNGGKVTFEIAGGGANVSSTIPVVNPITEPNGAWHHIAVTRDPAATSPRLYRLYVDGVQNVILADSGLNLDNTGPLEIGKWFTESYGGIYSGLVDEVQMFNRSLTATEIQSIYNAGSAGLAPPPTVIAISPNSGSAFGGTSVTISGSDLTSASAVSFGSISATGFTSDSLTQITAVSPSGVVGHIADITVTTPGGTSVTSSADQFTYTQDQARNHTTSTPYSSLATAIFTALPGEEILAYDSQCDGAFILDKGLALKGGYNATFDAKSGNSTTLNGSLTVTSGVSSVESVVVKGKLAVQGGSLRVNGVTVRL